MGLLDFEINRKILQNGSMKYEKHKVLYKEIGVDLAGSVHNGLKLKRNMEFRVASHKMMEESALGL